MNLYGMTRSDASQLILISLIGALIGSPLFSWISSKLEMIKRPYIVVYIILTLSWSTFVLFEGNPPLFLLTLRFLCDWPYVRGECLNFWVAVRKSFPIKESGIASGFANTGGFLSAVLLPSIFGYVLDHFQFASGSVGEGYYYGFITPVIFSMIGLIGAIDFYEGTKKSDKDHP